MREFIYFSSTARTSGNFNTDDLMKAGRMDIVCHVIINSFFLSRVMREDTILHLVFYGMPDPPKHIIMIPSKNMPETGKDIGSVDISKKDIAGLIKRILFKYKGKKTEVYNGYFVEKKSLFNVLDELEKQGREIYILDKAGESIRNIKTDFKNAVFLLGDHNGLPQKELKRLKKSCKLVSLGKKTYLASQAVTILNNELDLREN